MTRYRASRLWNRFAYLVLRLGQRMIWDETGRNGWDLKPENVATKKAEDIFCDKW